MIIRNIPTIVLVLAFGMVPSACTSKADRDARPGTAASPSMPDGAIRLTPGQAQAAGIQTAAAVEQEMEASITAIGRTTARAGGEARVFAPFAGRLIADPARLPRLGGFAKRGEIIAQVEQLLPVSERTQFGAQAAQLQTEAVQAQQEVDRRRTELERSRQLYEGGAIALKQLQEAEFNLKQAEAKFDGARRAREGIEAVISSQNAGPRRAAITAPISGRIAAADLIPGEQVEPSKSLLTIVDLNRLWVEVAVHESQLSQVRRTSRAEVATAASPGRTYPATLVTIGSVVDPDNRTIKAIYEVGNADGDLKIGLTAEARIRTGRPAKVLTISAASVLHEESESIVFVETEPGVFRRRRITIGARSGDRMVVGSGLTAGEKVVTTGAASLRSETLKGQIPEEEEDEKR